MTKLVKGDSKDTLYCSFCGKSQHDVERLIAGPTVFICNECTDLCEDIVWSDVDNRILVKVKVAATDTGFDEILYDTLVSVIAESYPDYELKFEFKSPMSDGWRSDTNILVFSAQSRELKPEPGSVTQEFWDRRGKEQEALKGELAETMMRLSISTQRFAIESERTARLSQELQEIKNEYLDHLRSINCVRNPVNDIRAVMFLDIGGFSKLRPHVKSEIVDMLRGIVPPLLSNKGGFDVNMWGDAIVATFLDANQAVTSAVKFIRHLSVEDLEARAGIAWGQIRRGYNPAIGRFDIDGPIVDFAARLEPMAEKGGILLSQEFSALEISPALGQLVPVRRLVKKDFANFVAGQEIELLELKISRN